MSDRTDRRNETYPHIRPGRYAVPDPGGALTFWEVDQDGRLRDFPFGERWRPIPPPHPPGLPRELRQEARAEWYDEVYWPYKDAIVAAIGTDPAGAGDRFRREYPHADLPPPASAQGARRPRRQGPTRPRQPSLAQQRRAVEALAAARLRQAGMSYREIGASLGMDPMTVYRRVQQAPSAGAAARAGLLDRADQITRALAAGLATTTDPETQDQFRRWLDDLKNVVTAIRTQL